MDWIEAWFGVAPDNGDGTLELLIMLVAAALVSAAILWRLPRARAALLRGLGQPRPAASKARRGAGD